MALGFGSDFRAGLREEQYSPHGAPRLWLAVVCAIGLMVLLAILQSLAGFIVYSLMLGPGEQMSTDLNTLQLELSKGALLGMLPAAFITIIAAWWLSRITSKTSPRGLPLHIPNMGVAGWVTIIVCFAVAVLVFYFGLFAITGLDPKLYAPSTDPNNPSSAGFVEQALANLSGQPLLFALAFPGVALAAPIVEELIFRGPLFAALTQSRVGPWGAVVITSAGWAALHMTAPWMFVAVIFLMGLALGLLLLRFGSVLVTIVCHCMWNSYSALAIASGLALQ